MIIKFFYGPFPGAYSIKLYRSVNYEVIITAIF